MKIRKNDTVTVIAGNDKGRSGKVLKVFPKTLRIIIEGINLRKRHTKPTQRAPQGGIQEKEAPVSYTHLRAHETVLDLVCRLLLEKKKKTNQNQASPYQYS